nr:MAG TPA: hypothetical protein [Caudoviricetes sp.]
MKHYVNGVVLQNFGSLLMKHIRDLHQIPKISNHQTINN